MISLLYWCLDPCYLLLLEKINIVLVVTNLSGSLAVVQAWVACFDTGGLG